jgi:NitT/TauT family transport system substrate-binding protein
MEKTMKTHRPRAPRALRRKVWALVGAVALVAGMSACATPAASPDGDAAGPVTVRVAGATKIEVALPFIYAQAQGYFADEGITIEETAVQSGQNAVALVATGQIEVALGGASAGMFNALGQGLGFRYVGDLTRTGGGMPGNGLLVVADPARFGSVAELAGARIAIAGGRGALASAYLGTILATEDLTLDDVEIVDTAFPDQETALRNGTVDGAIPAEPFISKILADGAAEALAPVPAGLPSISMLYNEDFAETPAAQGFMDAIARASAELAESGGKSDPALTALAAASGQDAATLENLYFSEYPSPPAPSPEMQDIQQIFLDAGLLDNDALLPEDEFVDASFAEAVQ